MSIDLDDLEAKACAATSGNWSIYVDLGVSYIDSDAVPATRQPLAKVYAANDAAYIVAAQPSVVIGLIARVRELEGALSDIIEWDDKFRASMPSGTEKDPVTRAVDRARTALGGSNG